MTKYKQAPKGFLKVNDTVVKDAYEIKDQVRRCERCDTSERPSAIGKVLVRFTCDYCRKDDVEFDYQKREGGISYTIKAMVNEMPENELRGDLKHKVHDGY